MPVPPLPKPRPLPVLAPPVVAIAEIHATNELRTGDLRVLCGIELRAGVELHNDKLHSSKQQGDIALKAHVASVCFKCFSYFRDMLQGFRMDVAKVDRDIAYVAVVAHVYCKCLFPMLHLFF